MSHGLKVGDKAKVVDDSDLWHNFEVGEVVEYYGPDNGYYGFKRTSTKENGLTQILKPRHFEKIEEESTMTEKRKVSAKSERNPKNFRNGDVVKVSDKKGSDAMVFVKFGDNYYNLTAGGQMKACKYLPPGTKEIITNLSGMGKFFLMSEEELEEQAGKVVMTGTGEFRWEPGHHGSTDQWISTAPSDFETIIKLADSYIQTDTTEEK